MLIKKCPPFHGIQKFTLKLIRSNKPNKFSPLHPPYFLKIYCNIIPPFMPQFSKWLFLSGFLMQLLFAFCFTHLILVDFISLTISREKQKFWSTSPCSFTQPPVVCLLLAPPIHASMLFPLNEKQQVTMFMKNMNTEAAQILRVCV